VPSARLETLVNRQHAAVAAVVAWLVFTSPWVAMLRRVPAGAGVLDYAHVVLGFAGLLLAVTYPLSCFKAGGWRTYFPWVGGLLGPVGRDLAGLFRGRIPSAEGGGLYSLIEGLLLLALAAAALTGAAWFLANGSDAAISWRECHVVAARCLIGLVVLHIVAVASHLLDFAG
jgi:Prokaryotic cytochrome b561